MMHLDRFLTLNVFRHLYGMLPQPEGIRIPILMYHSISDEPEKGHPYFWINTSPKLFAEQMKFLYDNNYKIIDLSEAVKLMESSISNPVTNDQGPESDNLPLFPKPSGPHPDRHVVLTFDDGYLDFYINVFSVLKGFGFKATVFLPTDFMEGKKKGLKEKQHLSWSQIRELSREGACFGSHTVTHRQLYHLHKKEVVLEIRKSKEVIEDKIGNEVRSFSYPYRFPSQKNGFIRMLRSILSESNYKNGVNTDIGVNRKGEDRFFLKRLPVNSSDDPRFFQSKLEGDYNWIRSIQKLHRNIVGSSGRHV